VALFALAWFLAIFGIAAAIATNTLDRLVDANAYWLTGHSPLYNPDYTLWSRGYSYPPAFAQLLWPLTQLEWPVFRALWIAAVIAAYAWLLNDLPWRLRLPFLIAAVVWASDNLYWALALVAVLGFRYPSLWALPLLTKLTPGVGIAWFAVRAEWRSLAIAIGTTVAIAAVSFALAPDAWSTWFDLIRRQDLTGTGVTNLLIPLPGLPIRGLTALVVVVIGARTERRWTVPIAMLLAQPDISFSTFGLLAALPRLVGPGSVNLVSAAPVAPDVRPSSQGA
jgi:hypothetical protein